MKTASSRRGMELITGAAVAAPLVIGLAVAIGGRTARSVALRDVAADREAVVTRHAAGTGESQGRNEASQPRAGMVVLTTDRNVAPVPNAPAGGGSTAAGGTASPAGLMAGAATVDAEEAAARAYLAKLDDQRAREAPDTVLAARVERAVHSAIAADARWAQARPQGVSCGTTLCRIDLKDLVTDDRQGLIDQMNDGLPIDLPQRAVYLPPGQRTATIYVARDKDALSATSNGTGR